MKRRFVAWAVLVMLSQGCAGCGQSDSSAIPVAPSPATPAPPPAPQGHIDLTGDYRLTFEVGGACEQVPKELRSRTYDARIHYHSSYESTDLFLADLSGATFHDQRPVWIEVTHRASGNSVWLDLAPSDNVIFEELQRSTYFMVAGGAGAASAEPTDLSTFSTRFTGYFNYCVASSEIGPQNQCSFDTMVRSMCRSENSRWTLTRR
jgi:hypothetical protein